MRPIAGFMSGMGPEEISATDYLAYDDATTGKNWNLPLGNGTLVAASLPSSTTLRLAGDAIRLPPGTEHLARGRRRPAAGSQREGLPGDRA